jgi:leukotriene-A4 hydrolase
VNPSKREEEEEEEEEERDKMTTVGGGQQFVRVDFTNIRPKEKKESFVDERFHGCLSSTTTTPRLNQENDDDDEEERNQIMCRRCAATAATSSSSVTENKEVHELKAIVLKNVLSSEECRELIEGIEKRTDRGYSFWSSDDTSATSRINDSKSSSTSMFRNSDTVEVRSKEIAENLWKRVRKFILDEELVIDEDHPLHESGLEGKWKANGINDHLLFNKYVGKGHFSPHTDGATVESFNRRSFYSVLVYLNTCKEGGETSLFYNQPKESSLSHFDVDEQSRYRWPKDWIGDAAKCERGSVLIFRQEIVHEGAPVGENALKIIIRTDVMYERVEKKCNDENGRRAYDLHKRAQNEESEGHWGKAIELLKQCRKVCPEYADLVRI